MRDFFIRVLTVVVIAGHVFPLPPSGIYELSSGGGEPRRVLSFLSEEKRKLDQGGVEGAALAEELRKRSGEEFGVSDGPGRGAELLSELYIRQYVEREHLAAESFELEEELFGGNSSFKDLREPARGSHGGDEDEMDRLLAQEKRLIEERLAWEKSKDEEYERRIDEKREEYKRLQDNRESWYDQVHALVEEGDEVWLEELEKTGMEWGKREFAAKEWNRIHREPFVASIEDTLRLRQESLAMIEKSELELHRGEDEEYWSGKKLEFEEYLEKSEQKFEELVRGELEKIQTPGELAHSKAEAAERKARRKTEFLSHLRAAAKGETVDAETLDGPDALHFTLVNLELQGGGYALESLQDDYRLAAEEHADAGRELGEIEEEKKDPLVTLPIVSEGLKEAFREEDESLELLQAFRRGSDFLEAEIETRQKKYEKSGESLRGYLHDLFLLPAGSFEQNLEGSRSGGLRSLAERRDRELYRDNEEYFLLSADMWLSELEEERSEGRLKPLLRDFALAYGHESDDIDPGYASGNAAYQSLKDKLNEDGMEVLEERQKSVYNRVVSDKRSRILYEFYKDYLEVRPDSAENSLLWRAAVEDQGRVLFDGIDKAAGDKLSTLKTAEKLFNAEAVAAAAGAATAAALLNFPLAATLTATAIAARVSASKAHTEAEDINVLRDSLKSSAMSGKNERSEFAGILADYSTTRAQEGALKEDLLFLTEETRSAEEWMDEWREGEGAFNFAHILLPGEKGEEIGFNDLVQPEDGIDAGEFLDVAEKFALGRLYNARDRRIRRWNEEYGEAGWAEQASMLRYALTSSKAGMDSEYTDELFALRAERERKLMEADRTAGTEELSQRRRFWEERTEEVLSVGNSFWESEVDAVKDDVERWERSFRENYAAAQGVWQGKLTSFQELGERIRRESIIFEAERASTLDLRDKSMDIDENMRLHLPAFSENSRTLEDSPDVQTLLTADMDGGFAGYNRRVSEAYSTYLGGLPDMYRSLEKSKSEAELNLMVNGLEELLGRESRELESTLRRANESVSRSVETSLRGAGYNREGGIYRREAVADVTLFNHEMERQQVRDYTFYEEPELLREEKLNSLKREGSAAEARQEFKRTLDEITGRRELVFGSYEGDGSSLFSSVWGDTERRFTKARDEFKSAATVDARDTEGLFFFHVGYAPVMDDEDFSVTEEEGYGELGRIYSEFYSQESAYREGMAMLEIPSWDRRLWDDDADNDGESDGWFSAPTTRGVVDLAVTAAASTLLSPGAGRLLANLGDDILFAAADVGSGSRTLGEAGLALGKNAAVSSAALASSSFLGGAEAAPIGGGEKNLFDNVFSAGGRSAANVGARSGISAITYDAGNGLGYDLEGLKSGLLSGSSIASLADGFLGTLGRNAFHNTFLQDAKSFGFSTGDTLNLESAGELGIDLAKGAVHYGIDGEVSLNILGIDDIARDLGSHTGLLQLNLSGEGHTGFSFGNGGIDLSPGRVGEALEGIQTMALQHRIASMVEDRGFEPSMERVLRFQHSFGDKAAAETLENIFKGTDTLSFDKTYDYLGLTRSSSPGERAISIGVADRDVSEAAQAKMLALVLQHEAHRDGISGMEGGWTEELERAVAAHAQMAAGIASDSRYSKDFIRDNPGLFLDMAAHGSGDPLSLSKLAGVYDNSKDYWRLTEDGFVDWDGSHHLWGPDGRLMAVHDRGSFSQSLASHLNTSRDEALDIMEQAGLRWSSKEGTYIQGESDYGIPAPYKLTAEYEIMSRYGSFHQGEMEFTGIDESATLHHYSQQRLETAVTGAPLNASEGKGYCLAESYAFAYVDSFPSVNWESITEVFKSAHWDGHFDPDTGYVGDKTEFTRILSRELDIPAAAVERRYDSVEALQTALSGMAGETGEYPDYRVVADYGSHFTHVRPDGLEINTYSGWDSAGKEPEGWRLITWEASAHGY